jgi:hypothetical protein
MGEYQRAK